ncbi:hypothetical protein E5D57_010716 [Metarhizium anisopliae]|nr:hypothetical protein E5D57_010716 [Metarhizium anisopliae]
MHSSVCLALLTCLYGTSFAAPTNAGSLANGAEHRPDANPSLPVVVDPEQGGLSDGVKRDAARSSLDDLVEDVPIVGGVGGLAGAASHVTKAAPGVGKRDVTDDVAGIVTGLTDGADIAGVTDEALAGQKRDGTVGSPNGITDKVPIGQNFDPQGIAESLLHPGGFPGVGAGSLAGKQKRDAIGGLGEGLPLGSPLGSAGGIAKPVTDIVGSLQSLDGNSLGGLTQ